MPNPTDRQGVLRLLGMTMYLARYTAGFSEMTAPLRELLKRENEFHWDDAVHGAAVERRAAVERTALSNAPVLQYYDVNKEVTVQADSSSTDLSSILLQDRHPIEFASRVLTPKEQSYAQIEELLAICFAVERMHTYLY